jgi:hypothetical protein
MVHAMVCWKSFCCSKKVCFRGCSRSTSDHDEPARVHFREWSMTVLRGTSAAPTSPSSTHPAPTPHLSASVVPPSPRRIVSTASHRAGHPAYSLLPSPEACVVRSVLADTLTAAHHDVSGPSAGVACGAPHTLLLMARFA